MLEVLIKVLVGAASLIVVLGVVVFIHELGHYQVGRWCKVKIDAFSMGFGPEIWGRTSKSGVRWRISAFPLGGYVKFAGDTDVASSQNFDVKPDDKAAGLLHAQSVGVRAAVAAAGPAANFVFAILIFSFIYGLFGEVLKKPIITRVIPGGAAAEAGFLAGDIVTQINGVKINDYDALSTTIMVSAGKKLNFEVQRGANLVSLEATPRVIAKKTQFGDMENQGMLSIETRHTEADFTVRKFSPVDAVVRGCQRTWSIIELQVKFLGALLRGGVSAGHLSGPLGMGQIAQKVTQNSIDSAGPNAGVAAIAESIGANLIQLMAVLSVSIGFMNLLPLPVLDGGHLVFYAAEALRGKPIPEKVQALSYRFGLACLLSLFVFATFQDLDRAGLFNLLKGVGAAG
jgi:regulator of sigma E protease